MPEENSSNLQLQELDKRVKNLSNVVIKFYNNTAINLKELKESKENNDMEKSGEIALELQKNIDYLREATLMKTNEVNYEILKVIDEIEDIKNK